VHSFANDPTRGVFILGLLAFVIGGSLLLFALRAPALSNAGIFAPLSREGRAGAEQYPAVLDRGGGDDGDGLSVCSPICCLPRKISVGAPFF